MSESPGGLPFHDFGGEGPLVHLAHANGYPPAAYQRMVAPLLARHRVIGLTTPMLRDGTDHRNLADWRALAEEQLRLLDELGANDVIGIGHSLGGVATMYAALARPERYRALVLVEPVFLDPAFLEAVREEGGEEVRLPLVEIALGRRHHWPSPDAAFAHWRDKRVFARIPDDVLRDYVDAALVRDVEAADPSRAYTLAYPREWEARIYATPPTDVWELVAHLAPPTLALRGPDSDTISEASWRLWQRLQPSARFVEIPQTGHLLTFERPEAVAAEIAAFIGE